MTQFTYKGVKQINNRISLNMTFTFTIHISPHFLSAREFQMENFQKYWSQNVGQDFIVLDFFHGRKILKVDGRDPQNREKNAPAGRLTCMWVRISFRARCTTLCDKVCQWLATGRWFSPGHPVSSNNKTHRHDITEILLKVALNTIKQTNKLIIINY
jgi:hypothetical protein